VTSPHQRLDELLQSVGEEPAEVEVEFAGSDPVLPVPLRIGEAGATAIGAAALQAARLWQTRTGRDQRVRVEVEAAAMAMRSNFYVRREAVAARPGPTLMEEARSRRLPGGGSTIFPTRDGRWIYLHRQFEHHRAIQESVLECNSDPESLTSAIAGWDALELEDAVFHAGACAGMIRTYEEWDGHEQARALDRQPVVEVVKIGESPPEPLPAADRPLTGVRVLDLTRVIAGPTVARTLAEHGADVLRIATDRLPDVQAQSIDTGHGKRSTVLDLASVGGVATLKPLIAEADVFSQSYRPGSMAGRGFSPEALAELRPGIIYCTLSAWGHEGPWLERRGFDTVVCAVSGIADEYGADGRPRLLPASAIDYSTGYLGAFGVMVALSRRAREGGSYLVRVSLARTGRWIACLPHVERQVWSSMPAEIPRERIEDLMVSAETPFGPLRFLAPVARLSETPARWERPSVPLNHDLPAWSDVERKARNG
jgi:crotonobetainyl-CoA:carnitine CoA-transferase CaiB-like acyl-CoA transferase